MKILKRIVENNTIVGYLVDGADTGTTVKGINMILPMCKKALYIEAYINPLTQAGYKYYCYDADTIETPDGTPISMLPKMDRSEVDDMEWFASVDLADTSALSDADASKYYTFREESAYTFKTEPSYMINTREELLHYLDQIKTTFYSVNYVMDNRPLNYFVNPEALFTIDELTQNPELKRYFDIIVKRHHFRNFDAYLNLIDWLCEQGVLNTKTPSIAEFLTAYYAWGPEGIKDKCTKVEVKMNVDGKFGFAKDPLATSSPEATLFDNRETKAVVIDANSNIHFEHVHESYQNVSDIIDFGRSRIIFKNNDVLFRAKRQQFDGKKYYAQGGAAISDVSDRLYITLTSDSGYLYNYKVSHNKVRLGLMHSTTNSALFSTTNNFSFATPFGSIVIPMDVVKSRDEYYLWNVAAVKAISLVKDKTYSAPVNSTSEFLLNDGVNPIAVIDMISHSISNNKDYNVNKRYSLIDQTSDMRDALELYLQDIPEYILTAYNLSYDDLDNGIESFLEMADVDDLRDRRDQMMAGIITPGQPGFDETYKDYTSKYGKGAAMLGDLRALVGRNISMHDAVDYYTKVRFIYDCLHGDISVDNFGEGIFSDLGANHMLITEVIMSVIYAEYGDTPDCSVDSVIANIDKSNLIDINRIIKTRDNAYKGYMADFASYRKTRSCLNTWAWAYCTKVFREISNAPIEQQRPYLMELVILENGSNKSKTDLLTRELLSKCVEESIMKAGFSEEFFKEEGTALGTWSEKKCALCSKEYLAAQLFFYIYAGGHKEPADENGIYHIKMHMQEGIDITVDVPQNVFEFIKQFDKKSHVRYITVYDYCKHEYNSYTSTGTFNWCLVNANVDPWHVKPKKGYAIKSYPLLPNYYDQTALDNANGVGFYEGGYNIKAISVEPLKLSYRDYFLPTPQPGEILMYEDMIKDYKEPDEYYQFLDPNADEFIFMYVKRWAAERKKANALGKKLISIPLKQDIVYGPLSYSCCNEFPPTSPVYSSEVEFDDKACQKVLDVKPISWKQFSDMNVAIETKMAKIKKFDINDTDIENLNKVKSVLSGEFNSSVPILVTGNYMTVQGDKVVRLLATRLTSEQISQFVQGNILTQISDNKYFIRAVNGDFVLEV